MSQKKRGSDRRCSECGSAAPGKDGLCAACRAVRAGEVESRTEYYQRIGAKGGKKTQQHRRHGVSLEGLPPLEDHASVKTWLEYLAQELAAERVGRKLAAELRKILTSWVSVHKGEVTDELLEDLQEKVQELARQVEQQGQSWR